ncbi:MAG: MmgE/PrpD family protein, partial [Steroidobacteraceae bacterium]
ETARHCLIDALGRGLEALRDPDCACQIGPLVPGAVMPGGARVPGTSLELEPAQAAFCTGLMLCRPVAGDPWLASSGTRATDSLGALLAAADYQARKAAMEGKPPPRVRDVLAVSVKALEIQGVLAAALGDGTGAAALRCVRVAAAAVVSAQLGGSREQIAMAVSHAFRDGEMVVHPDERYAIGRRDWAAADTLGRAVRLACQATASARPSFLMSAGIRLADLAASPLGAGPATAMKPLGTALMDGLAALQKQQQAAQLTRRFQAAVDRYYTARQAERVKTLFAAPERLDDLPVNEMIAALVTNGSR